MSERKRQLARLRKQRQRSSMNPDVQRQEARRHQHASTITRQACFKMWSLNILNHLLCSFSAALEAC